MPPKDKASQNVNVTPEKFSPITHSFDGNQATTVAAKYF